MRKALKLLILLLLQVGLILALGFLFLPVLTSRLEPRLLEYMASNLTEEQRREIYDTIASTYGGLWDATPEPEVARLAKRDWKGKGAFNELEVTTNNAGLRSARPFTAKGPATFRIVCLGDSFVYGAGGLERDRFSDQLEAFYREQGVTVAGAAIESYAVGLGSWTMVQEARYLAQRLSEYAPDVILMLSVPNDITESSGVTGAGVITEKFSEEARQWGSGVWLNTAHAAWRAGGHDYAALQWDLCPASHALWTKGLERVALLVRLQRERGGRILLSTLNPTNDPSGSGAAFTALFGDYAARAGIDAPRLEVTYLRDRRSMVLPNNDHPNREGHRVLRDQYVLVLHRLGWVPVPEAILPTLDDEIAFRLDPEPDLAFAQRWKEDYVERCLRPRLDFAALGADEACALLGGIFRQEPEGGAEDSPWATVRAGFLLRLPENSTASALELVLRVPPRIELFPFHLEVRIDGDLAHVADLATLSQAGELPVRVDLGRHSQQEVVEVVLETGSYFCTIEDGRMLSYQLVSAGIVPGG